MYCEGEDLEGQEVEMKVRTLDDSDDMYGSENDSDDDMEEKKQSSGKASVKQAKM